MLKKLLFLLVLIFSIALVACGDESDDEKNDIISLRDRYYYNYNSLDDLVIKSNGIKEVKDFKLGDTVIKNVLVKENEFIVSGSLVKQKGYGEHIATCTINDKGYSFIVEIVDDRLPIYKGENEIRYNGNDIVLEFELYTGKFVSLLGDDITTASYKVEDGKVTIFAQAGELLKKSDNEITYVLSYVDVEKQEIKEISGVVHIKKTIFGPPSFE